MDPNIKKAEEYIAEARGLRSNFFFRNRDKTEEKILLFEKAANCYKMAKAWTEAAKSFTQAAELCCAAKSYHDAATHYVNAATVLKKGDALQAIELLTKAIEIYTDAGRFTIAAKYHMDIAAMQEEKDNLDQAMRHYEEAAGFYDGEGSSSYANKCKLCMAQIAGKLQQYEKGAAIYDEVGRAYVQSTLLKYSAKGLLFNAVLYKLVVDKVEAKKALEKYQLYPMFEDSRECKLLVKLNSALDDQDEDAFTQCVKDYVSISSIDELTTSILLRLKKTICAVEEDIT